ANKFNPDNTNKEDFKINQDETIKVDMMHLTGIKFNYTETSELQILKMPYKGNDLSMIIILPKENNITLAESELNHANLVNWINNLEETEININIPKFKFETEYNLNNILIDMGMKDAFTPDIADFSGMDGTKYLYISNVLHKAFVEVNEEGTEAAAATGVIVVTKAIDKTFNADHPFIFLIQHEETGAIIFMGKIMKPTTAE
ncbi:MAG: serpin family protein, partial [Candidatus Thermoplasmatota archaeon]|nr:serpin family protein [Candidatus Thermoplasmatota archaeon]